ncbi:MAG: hypothetical protein KZQ96_03130 [Candidatus Thiodiazotropha sp. (ex Lucinoma borealis)]|nr:hypothetical protein [Candidatus Thiodiazotropha sp. (ex Lucinoma borealis)]
MSVPALQIRQMHNRYCIYDRNDADGLQRQLDHMVTDRLPAVLERSIGSLHQSLGMNADCLVAVRRLNIRIQLADFSANAEPGLIDHIVESWARALLNGLERIVSTSGFTPGQALLSDTLAIFPSLISARRHHIRQLVRNGALPWWSRALLDDDADAQALPRLLIKLATIDPKTAAECIVELTDDPGPVWLTRFDATQSAAAGRALIAAATVVGDEVRDSRGWQGDSALLTSLPAPQHDLLRRCADADSATLLFGAFQLLADLPVVAGYTQLKTRLEQLLAQPHRLAENHSLEGTDMSAAPEMMFIKDIRAASFDTLENPLDSAPMSVDVKSVRASESASSDADLTMTGTSGIPVGCGGLLFLIRFALRKREQSINVNQAMLALGTYLLNTVFDRLSPAARRAAWCRDAGLLQVFAGLREPLSDIDEQCHPDSALSWGRVVSEAIAARIADDVAAAPRGSEYVFGRADEPLSAMDRLLLRPGHLRVSETEVHLILPSDTVDIGLRRGGWDIDPGWVPQLGRVIRFEYRKQ